MERRDAEEYGTTGGPRPVMVEYTEEKKRLCFHCTDESTEYRSV